MHDLALSAAGRDDSRPFGLSLCAGAGGLDLGMHLAIPGYRTVGYIERDAYAAATLVARMEDQALDTAPVWDNVADFNGRAWRGVVDIIHGGYPCQPFSVAGKKLGDKDPRHLWPHIARIVGEVAPALCFFENVGGHLRLGFEQVHDDLSAMGYRIKAGLFTAEEVGASHKRERLFILAYAESAGERRKTGDLPQTHGRPDRPLFQFACGADGTLANATGAGAGQHQFKPRYFPQRGQSPVGDPDRAGLERRDADPEPYRDQEQPFPPGPTDTAGWERWLERTPHLEPSVCRGADGLAHRVDRLRLCGNGVVPLVAAYAFRTLAAAANLEPGGS